ncbi:hypothetical protein ACR3K2_29640 [Cryptosporidium serpentis]
MRNSEFIIYFLVGSYIQMHKYSNIQMESIFIDLFSLLNIKYENNSNSYISENTTHKLFRIGNNSKLISNNNTISNILNLLEYKDYHNFDKYNMSSINYGNIKDFDKFQENKSFNIDNNLRRTYNQNKVKKIINILESKAIKNNEFDKGIKFEILNITGKVKETIKTIENKNLNNNLKLLSPNNTELDIKNITDKSINLENPYNLEDIFKPIEKTSYFNHNYSTSDNIYTNTSNLKNNSSNKFKFFYIKSQMPSHNSESISKNESNIFGIPYVYWIRDNYRNESYPVCEIKSCEKFNEDSLIKEIVESNTTKEFCKSNDLNGLFISNNILDLNSGNILIYNDVNNSRFEISEINHNPMEFRMLKQKIKKKKKKTFFEKLQTTLKWFVCAETVLAGCACCLMVTETCLIAVAENSNAYDMTMYGPYNYYDPYRYPSGPIRVNNPIQNKDNIQLGINSRSSYRESKVPQPIGGLGLLDILNNI